MLCLSLLAPNHHKVDKLSKSLCSAHYLLWYYAKFDTCTIIMLKKLFGVGFFDGSIDHLIFCQAILFVFLGKFNLPFVVRIVVLTFLRHWVLIILLQLSFV